MKKYIGLFIGTAYVLIAFGAFRNALEGLEGGHMDLLVWWTVISFLLLGAGAGALLGTWSHAWADQDAH